MLADCDEAALHETLTEINHPTPQPLRKQTPRALHTMHAQHTNKQTQADMFWR